MQTETFDFIIIGAGCAGLSLAYRLADTKYKVCVLEKNSNNVVTNKNWSFWKTYNHPYEKIIKKSWDSFSVSYEKQRAVVDCKNYPYQALKSKDFEEYNKNKITNSNNINILYDVKELQLKDMKDGVEVSSSNFKLHCNHVFDSSPVNLNSSIWQVFKGLYIEHENLDSIFKIPHLMDFTDQKKDEFHFMYFLPFTNTSSLIESTYFSKKENLEKLSEDYIKQFIKDEYKINSYNIISKEAGKIPMSLHNKFQSGRYITKIGSYSGVTRPSTGYTFLNIQKQIDYLVKNIDTKNYNFRYKPHSKYLLFMDKIYLSIIENDAKKGKIITFRMFEKINRNTVIKFLSDIPTITDIFKIIFSLPKLIFIKHLLKVLRNE